MAAGPPSDPEVGDINLADWDAAERRHSGHQDVVDLKAPGPSEAATAWDNTTSWDNAAARDNAAPRDNAAAWDNAGQYAAGRWGAAPVAAPPLPTPGNRSTKWRTATRCWAVLKICSFSYTTWWLVGMAKMPVGSAICSYGLACFFAGVGARWRKRWFGPGQLLEPELYEEIGGWFYKMGAVVVLIGGAVYIAQSLH